jgi:3-methyladenine DNA glycosylase AlkD
VLVEKDTDAALIERAIRAAGSPSRAASEQHYLKSSLEFSGTTVPDVRAIVVGWRRSHRDLTREALTQLAAALWDWAIFECRLAAVILLTDQRRLLAAGDAALVGGFLRTAGTWALVDGLAADVMGSLVQRFPELRAVLDSWVADDDFWLRRYAAATWTTGSGSRPTPTACSPSGSSSSVRRSAGCSERRPRRTPVWSRTGSGRGYPECLA